MSALHDLIDMKDKEIKELSTRVAELENQAKMDLEKLTEAITLGSTQAEEYDHRLSTLLKASEGMEKALEDVLIYRNAMSEDGEVCKICNYDFSNPKHSDDCYVGLAKQALADFRAVKETMEKGAGNETCRI